MNKKELLEAKAYFIDGDHEKGIEQLDEAIKVATRTEKAVDDIKRWRSGLDSHDSRRGGIDRCLSLLTAGFMGGSHDG